METLFKYLWRLETLPTSYFELVRRLQETKAQMKKWKVSACREGARMAWTMMKVHFSDLDPTEVTERGSLADGRKELQPEDFFEEVMPVARISEENCKHGTLIDNL